MSGVKHDADKPRTDLLDPLALEGLAQVLGFGAKKYAAHNWRGGISYGRLIAAALRHLFAIMRGEDIDPESGLMHVDHLGCCWMFLSNMMKTRRDLDDRYRPAGVLGSDIRVQSDTHGDQTRDDVLPSGTQAPAPAGLQREDVQPVPGRDAGRLVLRDEERSLDRVQVGGGVAALIEHTHRFIAEAKAVDQSTPFGGT